MLIVSLHPCKQTFWKTEENKPLPNNSRNRTAIENLWYLTITTRSDIATPVGILSRKVMSPTSGNWTTVKRVARHWKRTRDFKLKLPASKTWSLHTIAGWTKYSTNHKSTNGFLFLYGNGSISWASCKQSITALSCTVRIYCSLRRAHERLQNREERAISDYRK